VELRRFCTLSTPGESARSLDSPLPFFDLPLGTLSTPSFGPRLIPPLMVLVSPLILIFPPASWEECELLRERLDELELDDRPRREELLRLELADKGRDTCEGGARLEVIGGEAMATAPSDDMLALGVDQVKGDQGEREQ